MSNTTIKIKKNNQKYFKDLLKLYPQISGGRKKYTKQYSRVLKNLLFSKSFKIHNQKKINIFLNSQFCFKDTKYLMKIKW